MFASGILLAIRVQGYRSPFRYFFTFSRGHHSAHLGISLGYYLHLGISTGIYAISVCIQGLISIPVCIQESCVMLSPYAYWYLHDPNMHTGRITCHAIPVCIKGSRSIPVCIRESHKSPYACGIAWKSPFAYGDYKTWCTPCMHTGIDLDPRMQMGIPEIPICIRRLHGH